MKRVVVGLSGGVDSSVAAHLLLEKGYEVIGLFMRNWHDESVTINNECPWIDDSNDAMLVAEHLGIPLQVLDLSDEYRERIVDYMFAEYEAGRTPNPDVLCNREIKFDIFLDAAMKLGADFVATGHYCQKATQEVDGKEVHSLIAGADNNKDQSYFLCQLKQEQLSKALFPIGHLVKPKVREIATEIGLPTANKRDSQGLCFIGKVKLPVFLQQQLKSKKGRIIEISPEHEVFQQLVLTEEGDSRSAGGDINYQAFKLEPFMGEVVGEHIGAHFFTVGQRKGLHVGGKAEPLFVIGTDVKENVVYVGQGDDHPGLYRRGLYIPHHEVHWVREDLKMTLGESRSYLGRIRYRQPLQPCTLFWEENHLRVVFESAQRGIAAGQFFAWYDGEELIGSAVM
ncbi:MAG: tRNA 2-thiouridine(34) synthase MnmA [Flavobacteriales bacterium]|nr:tRNA 2-thiouridine(34) synthase MnmA [Flavobacteriales bacterium]